MQLEGNANYSEIVGKIGRKCGLEDAEIRRSLDSIMAWSSQYAEELEEITHAGIGTNNTLWVAAKDDKSEGFVWFGADGEYSFDDDMADMIGVSWDDFDTVFEKNAL
ncbi:MAG: hypothetical protein LBL76_02225 [Treponema sp.]|jgi:hypothetical protein|nr:hypothetical protein [Treponema sp.]